MTQQVLKTQITEFHTVNGLLEGERARAAESVRSVLADTFTLLVATQGIHWNVQGPLFYSIHMLTEKQYQDMFGAVDQIAERIRALGFLAPLSAEEMISDSNLISPNECDELDAQIQCLIEGNELITRSIRQKLPAIEAMYDVKTAEVFSNRIGTHEENAWQLRAIIS